MNISMNAFFMLIFLNQPKGSIGQRTIRRQSDDSPIFVNAKGNFNDRCRFRDIICGSECD